MTKTSRYKGLVLSSFLAPEIDMIFGDVVGASLVSPFCQLLTLQLASRSLCLVFCFVCVWLLFCWLAFFLVWFPWHCDGFRDCVLVLCQNFCSPPFTKMDNVTALINELTDIQHAI